MLLVLVFIMGAQFYYPFGLQVVLYAAGCVPAWPWLRRSSAWRNLMIAGLVINSAVSLVLALPLVPLASLGGTPVPGINQVARDSVGWPRYVAQVAGVYRAVPSGDRSTTVLYASNYGEAGALDRYGGRYHLPPVYSGQNQLYYVRRPPAEATTVVFVGGQYADVREHFAVVHRQGAPGQRHRRRQRGAGRTGRHLPRSDRWLVAGVAELAHLD